MPVREQGMGARHYPAPAPPRSGRFVGLKPEQPSEKIYSTSHQTAKPLRHSR